MPAVFGRILAPRTVAKPAGAQHALRKLETVDHRAQRQLVGLQGAAPVGGAARAAQAKATAAAMKGKKGIPGTSAKAPIKAATTVSAEG